MSRRRGRGIRRGDARVELRLWCFYGDGDCERYVEIATCSVHPEAIRRALRPHGWTLLEDAEPICGSCWNGWYAEFSFAELVASEQAVRS